MIAVVIPTIPGREALYDQTVAAYKATAEVAIVTVRNRPSIGQAWQDGAEVARGLDADYLHLSADDVEPAPGWAQACIDAIAEGWWPSPRVLHPDGSLHSCGTMGGGMLLPECATGTPCGSSPFPFMRMKAWDALGPCPSIHYYADDYLGWRARRIGLDPTVVRGFELRHLEGLVGRDRMVARSAADRAVFLASVGLGWEAAA